MADQTGLETPRGLVDGSALALPPDAVAPPDPEIPTAMLDVHAPHETIHTWKNFLIHIAAIVVGLLIAVCLEQTVEFFHHRDQREQLEAALRRDGEANREYIKDDVARAQRILDWAMGQSAALERAGATGALIVHQMPPGFIGSPDAGVWPSARASGVTNLLPPSAQNWLEYLADLYNETFVSSASANGRLTEAYAALDQAVIGHAIATPSGDINVSVLTAAQRLMAAECLRVIAERARDVMRRLLLYDAGNEFILSTPLDQLDTPEAGERYSQIYKAKVRSHPAASFVFGGN